MNDLIKRLHEANEHLSGAKVHHDTLREAIAALGGDQPAKTYTQEFDKDGWHRIVCSDGRKTHWVHYQSTAFMDGYISATAYYMGKEGIFTAEQFCKETSTGVEGESDLDNNEQADWYDTSAE